MILDAMRTEPPASHATHVVADRERCASKSGPRVPVCADAVRHVAQAASIPRYGSVAVLATRI